MAKTGKYAGIEIERRFLLRHAPTGLAGRDGASASPTQTSRDGGWPFVAPRNEHQE